MADHLITGQHVVMHVTCGNLSCAKWWDQADVDLTSPGWLVCPHCNWSAPTNVDRDFARALSGKPRQLTPDRDFTAHPPASVNGPRVPAPQGARAEGLRSDERRSDG